MHFNNLAGLPCLSVTDLNIIYSREIIKDNNIIFFSGSSSSFPPSQEESPSSELCILPQKISHLTGKPINIKRGPGRPRKEKLSTNLKAKKSHGVKLKKWKRYLFIF